jgi:hypothetical protein
VLHQSRGIEEDVLKTAMTGQFAEQGQSLAQADVHPEMVSASCILENLKSLGIFVDGQGVGTLAGSAESKAADIAKDIQNPCSSFDALLKESSVLSLIEVEARLLSEGQGNLEAKTVLFDHKGLGNFSPKDATSLRKPFCSADVEVRALVYPLSRDDLEQSGEPGLP